MTFTGEIEKLQRRLEDLARCADDQLMERYQLERPPLPPGLYWKLRWLAGWGLRGLKALRIWRSDPWPVRLKTSPVNRNARPILIWAIGTERNTLREVCGTFATLLESWPGLAPVLVTDVPDFAYYSRLGWLVEYVPSLSGEGQPYDERKLKYLARLYRGSPALPVTAYLESSGATDDIWRWLDEQ